MASRAYRLNGKDFADQVFDDEIILLNLTTGTYYALGGSAIDFWRALSDARPIASIEDAMALRYGSAAEQAGADLATLIGQLLEESILEEAEPSEEVVALAAFGPASGYRPPTFEKHNDMQDLLTLDPIHDVDPQKGWPHY